MNADKQTQVYFFAAVLIAALVLNLAIFWPFAGAIVVALTLVSVFGPVYRAIKKGIGHRESLASLLTVILVLVIIVAPLIFFGTLVVREAGVVYMVFKGGGSESYLNNLNSGLNSALEKIYPAASFDIRLAFEKVLDFFVRNVAGIFSSVSGAVFSLFLALMALYYLLKDGEKFKKVVMNLSPLADEHDDEIFNRLAQTVSSVIKGSLLVAVLQGLLTGLGFLVFGIPNPALWGALAVLAALIPMIGTALVLVPAVIYLFVSGSAGASLGLLLWGAIIVGSVDNLLRPKLFERGINIHPFFILISVLGGLEFFGAVGFLLGPLLLSLLFSLLDIYKKEFKRDVEQNSEN